MKFTKLNGSGDLGMDASIRDYIGKIVQVVKVCKSGLYQISLGEGKFATVPKRNLDAVEVYLDLEYSTDPKIWLDKLELIKNDTVS